MAKAKRNIEADLKLVDFVIELLDARIPLSSENPDIRKICRSKKRLVLLNKSDLADDSVTKLWIRHFRSQSCEVVALDARMRGTMSLLHRSSDRILQEKRERDKKRGIVNLRAARAMVCGIPNVGKSTLINSMIGKASAKTGDKPGVTKGNQWLAVGNDFLLLDTPGVLWPKFEDPAVGAHLAMIGAISDQVMNAEELSMELLSFLLKEYPALLAERYGLTEETILKRLSSTDFPDVIGLDPRSLCCLDQIAERHGCLKRGGVPDYERAAKLFLEDFRSGRLGKISLERPSS